MNHPNSGIILIQGISVLYDNYTLVISGSKVPWCNGPQGISSVVRNFHCNLLVMVTRLEEYDNGKRFSLIGKMAKKLEMNRHVMVEEEGIVHWTF